MDGRNERWQQSHDAIVAAALALVVELDMLPGAQAIADRAGVSKRSLFHHFPDMEALFSDAAEHQHRAEWSVLERTDLSLPFEERLRSVTAQRAELFERIGAVRRVATRSERTSATLGHRMDRSRAALRRHVGSWLAPEMAGAPEPVVHGVHLAASWEAWEVLRRDQLLPVGTATQSVRSMIRGVLTPVPAKEA